ncbi:MAG: 30S ribosomal protein S18 [Patescibacteria group bacterium]|nr:30S ribosomal protein S18 [Patescibacteria group bacterium]
MKSSKQTTKKYQPQKASPVSDDFKIDYKNIEFLSKFISERGKILPRSKTGLSSKQQRKLCIAIKRARHVALLPFVVRV